MASPAVTTVSTAVDGLDTDLLAIAAVGIGIGAAVLAVKKGWGLVKRFF